MSRGLAEYVFRFNEADEEHYRQDIPNAEAADFLLENIPRVDLPDEALQEAYYFRFWTLRKHIKRTEDGFVITEFLPPVPWAGKHNTIIAAAGHHIAELKWLKCGRRLIEDYASFWLSEKSKTYLYSAWLPAAIYEFCRHEGDDRFGIENLDRMTRYYETVEREQLAECGLFWSFDNNDAMEYSISGTAEDLSVMRGLRPTLNCYMAANARAIAHFAAEAGREALAALYMEKHEALKDKINALLWDGEFYKAIHTKELSPCLAALPAAQNARELIGYIPWCFDLAPKGRESAFLELKREDGFLSPYGLRTAERRHPRYLYPVAHECLWNGYIWPFATSQVLRAMARLMEMDPLQTAVTAEDYYGVLRTYALSHRRRTEDGKILPWIDEVIHPETGEWSSRQILKDMGWQAQLGGLERGKDYNHSTFADALLCGLLGICSEGGRLCVYPRVPRDWDYFAVENLWIGGKCYSVFYDKNGERYGRGKGLFIEEMEK